MFSSKIAPSLRLGKHIHFVSTAWSFCPAVPKNGTKKCAGMGKMKSPLSMMCNFLIEELEFVSVWCGDIQHTLRHQISAAAPKKMTLLKLPKMYLGNN